MSIAPRPALIVAVALSIWLAWSPNPVLAQTDDLPAERRALARAASLAGLDPGVRAVLIEPDLAPNPEPLRRLDAFVVRETNGTLRRVIYVNRQSDLLRQAAAGSTLHVLVLAAVVHHEVQHLAGASELDARRAEVELFRTLLVREGQPSALGERYLEQLARAAR
jgi:hypothetical protein